MESLLADEKQSQLMESLLAGEEDAVAVHLGHGQQLALPQLPSTLIRAIRCKYSSLAI
jgi:hypothetical protein